MALGATPRKILTMVLREAALLMGIGPAIGTVLAALAAMSTRRLLFGLGPNDPVTLFMAIAMPGVVAMFASYLPAMRATRVDPMTALRDE